MTESENKPETPLSELSLEDLEARIIELDLQIIQDEKKLDSELFQKKDALLRERARRLGEKIEEPKTWGD